MKVAISYAHSPASPGACHNGMCENEESITWSNMLAEKLLEQGVSVAICEKAELSDKVAFINKRGCDLALEIHFNACGDCGAQGAETLYYPDSELGKHLASCIQQFLPEAMSNSDRGIKEGWYQQDEEEAIPLYFLKNTNCPAVIIEPEFIENYADIDFNRERGVNAIMGGIMAYLQTDAN